MCFAALHHVEQPVAVEHLTGMLKECHQQAKFGRRNGNHCPFRVKQAALQRIELPAVELEQFGFRQRQTAPHGAAQDAANPGDQLSRIEWFDDIVIRADLEADDPVGRLAPGSQQDSRDRPGFRQMAAQRQAIFARHHDVEQDQIGGLRAQQAARLGRAGGLADGEPLADKIFGQGFAQSRLVIDQQYKCRCGIVHQGGYRPARIIVLAAELPHRRRALRAASSSACVRASLHAPLAAPPG